MCQFLVNFCINLYLRNNTVEIGGLSICLHCLGDKNDREKQPATKTRFRLSDHEVIRILLIRTLYTVMQFPSILLYL